MIELGEVGSGCTVHVLHKNPLILRTLAPTRQKLTRLLQIKNLRVP